jgi:uncharacterized RDD family membrane protein YckC
MGIPATAGGGAAGGAQLATPVQRLLAYLVDVGTILVVMIVLGVIGFVLGKISQMLPLVLVPVYLAAILGLFLYVPAFDNPYTQRGQTIGKKVIGIKIVKDDGTPFGLVDALLRNVVGYAVSGMVLYLGFIWILIDAEHRGWHDKIAKTKVMVA